MCMLLTLACCHRSAQVIARAQVLEVTGAVAALVLDCNWMEQANPRRTLPRASARNVHSSGRCSTFRNRLQCALLVHSMQISQSFCVGSAISQLRCNIGAGGGMSSASVYAQVACRKLQVSNATFANIPKACSALPSGAPLLKLLHCNCLVFAFCTMCMKQNKQKQLERLSLSSPSHVTVRSNIR